MKTNQTGDKTDRNGAWRRRAFTLVEMLLVLTILAILAGLVLPRLANKGKQARIDATRAEIGTFKTALSMYEVDMGSYPTGRNGLQALMVRPNGANSGSWKGPYLDKEPGWVPTDQWGRPYVYECPGKHNPNGYDVYSLGPEGAGGNDEIGNWTPKSQTQN